MSLTSGDMKTLATAYKACSGHGKNQSMLVLFTIPVKRHKTQETITKGHLLSTQSL